MYITNFAYEDEVMKYFDVGQNFTNYFVHNNLDVVVHEMQE